MSHERAVTIRRLSENDLRLAQGIDVSEDGQSVFRYINGELTNDQGRHGVQSLRHLLWRQ